MNIYFLGLLLLERITTCMLVDLSPIVTCSQLPQVLGGNWECDPDVKPGHGYHVGTVCVFYCHNLTIAVAICNENGLWVPDDPNDRPEVFSCKEPSTSTTTSSTFSTTTSLNPTTSSSTTSKATSTSTTLTTPQSTSTSTTFQTSTIPSSSTTSVAEECPFTPFSSNAEFATKSMYCSRDVCPAVIIVSQGETADFQQESLGCYIYEGSINNDMYPVYINQRGQFLTPDYHSNPWMGITRWIVSSEVLAVEGTIRNFMHDDITCPYDMHDGWQFFDNQTGQWIHDESLQVLCVGHDVL